MPRTVEIAVAMGDGSAPEMMGPALNVLTKAAGMFGVNLKVFLTPMGWVAFEEFGDTLPKVSMETAKRIGTLFFGGVGDPAIDRTLGVEHPEMMPEGHCLLPIRNELGLLINTRPAIFYPELRGIAKVRPETIPNNGVRQIWLRFLLQDSYFGNKDLRGEFMPEDVANLGILLKHEVTGDEAIVTDLAYYRKETLEQYFKYAFQLAKKLDLPVISVDKANVMPRYVFWRKTILRVVKEFPDVKLQQHIYVDNCCQTLFNPQLLNGVIVCGNEHGDILSDGAAEAVGSLGLMHSSAVNPTTGAAMFESGAGTAPALRGTNTANPLGRILAGAIMMRHVGEAGVAEAIETAVQEVLRSGFRTRDVARASDDPDKCLGTKEMGDKVVNVMTALA